jgi:hypothetical protein
MQRHRTQLMLILVMLLSSILIGSRSTQQTAYAAVGQNAFVLSGNRPESGFQLDYIEVPYSSSLNAFTWGITLEAWVKRNDANRFESIVCNGWQQSYCLSFAGSKVRLQTSGGASFMDSQGSVPAGTWTHVAATYDGTTQKIYINGVLDSVHTYPGSVGQASNTPLGIGVDLVNDFMQNYFNGRIDTVRIWNYARSAQDIRAAMFQAMGGPTLDLQAEWRLDGDAGDSTGGNNGIVHGGLFTNDGAIPHDIRIPQRSVTPVLDGVCDTGGEYTGATQITVGDAPAYLLRTTTDLWVCFDQLAEPTQGHDNWAAVYLDANRSRDQLAQPSDLSLEAHSDGSLRARAGDGSGDYTVTTAANGKWDGKYRAFFNGLVTLRSAEFRIGNSLIGGGKGHVIGLSLAQHWIGYVGDDRNWPALALYDSPASWSAATLGSTGPPRTFIGKVVYQPRDPKAAPVGIGGAGVNLVGSDPSAGEAVVAVGKSAPDGSFTLTSDDDYTRHRLELDPAAVPHGYSPQSASGGGFGTSADARTIDYGIAGAGTYVGATFALGDALPAPPDPTAGPYFLVVASQQVIANHALDDFVDFKRRLGFLVEVASVEDAEQQFGGASRLQKIRNLEIDRLNRYGSRFKYVMLVGWDSTIPIGHVGAGYPYLIQHCQDTVNWPTEWFYADLTSNYDTNGNGCWADVGDVDHPQNYPGDDPKVAYHLTVAVGRIPFDDAATVRNALRNSMRFEQQSEDFKLQTLLGESMMDLKHSSGQDGCWSPVDDPNGHYLSAPCNLISTAGTDNSYLGYALRQNVLQPNQYTAATLYENAPASVGGSPYHSPQQVSEARVVTELGTQAHGFVQLGGHGSNHGVYRTIWTDLNGDGAVQNATAPTGNPPKSAWEISQPGLFSSDGLFGQNGVPAVKRWFDHGAIFVLAACSTGFNQDDKNFGISLLSQGVGVAWAGGLSVVAYTGGWAKVGDGAVQDVTYDISRRVLANQARLGDAVWGAMSSFIANNKGAQYIDPRSQLYDLFGDPTLSYWGNPGGDSTLAAWPMLRQNALGQGNTTLSGPGVPQQRWTYSALARVLDPIPPSPIVSNNGEVIVAHGNFVDVLRGGTLYQRLTLNQPAYGTPALAADGTIYALDRGGLLYAFPYNECLLINCVNLQRSRRWALDLGATPITSPIVGSDGFIALAVAPGAGSSVLLVRPDGVLSRQLDFSQDTVVGGALAVTADRGVYFTTDRGYLVRLGLFDPTCLYDPNNLIITLATCAKIAGPGAAYTTPPLLAYGGLYAGREDGTLVRLNPATLAQQFSFSADSAITAGPIAGPGGQVLIGTENGTLYSLAAGLSLRWQRSTGAPVRSVPAFSADALYVANGDYLYAYNPFSGAIEWLAYLGSGAKGGSAAVGYGREVYVQTGNGPIVAIGEGWAEPPSYVLATPKVENVVGGGTQQGIVVQWATPAVSSASASVVPAQASAIGLLIQRSSDGGNWQDLAVLPPGTTVYSDTSVLSGTRYRYRVQALDAAGNDSDFATMTASVRSMPVLPAAPTLGPVTTLAADSLGLSWTIPSGSEVTAYRVERSSNAGGPFSAVAVTPAGANSFSDTGLAPGTSYFYRVVALNDAGASPPSNVQRGTTRQRTLPAPQNVAATLLNDTTIRISWNGGPAGATAVLEVNALGEAGYRPLSTSGALGPYTYQEPHPNSYGYRVKFVQGNAESDYATAALRVVDPGLSRPGTRVLLPLVRR